MAKQSPVGMHTQAGQLLGSAEFQSAKRALLDAIQKRSSTLRQTRGSTSPEVREAYLKDIQSFNKRRGRDLYYPYISSGLGAGPYAELLDGSVKFDLITGIGINLLGHSHPALMAEMIDAVPSDLMQGNLEPGFEAAAFVEALLARVGAKSRIAHAWLTTCGTMANEIALKIIRQKRQPATKVLAFRDCFAGRSTAMQEITDNPGYRDGQPLYGEVAYLTYYDAKTGLERSIERTLGEMRDHLTRYPGRFAAVMIELVQGEGGFNYAPREFYVKVFEEARKQGLAIWVDEVQTFARTGQLFAYQTFGLEEYIDVATVAKTLQASVVMFSPEYNPKPGLVAGTFSGSAAGLRCAKRTLEVLEEEGHLGPDGKINRLSKRMVEKLQAIGAKHRGSVGEIRAIGAMIAFEPFDGKMETVKATLLKLFDLGAVAFYCGHGPYLIRMLPPFGAMTEQDVDTVCGLIEKALTEVGAARK